MTPSTLAPLASGVRVCIEKGCKDREINKGDRVTLTKVTPLGAEYGHSVQITFQTSTGRTLSFYARHKNRLSDPIVRMNDGNPSHVIEVRRV